MRKPEEKQPPLYAQIRSGILQAIENRELQPGDRAPSERELTQQYGVSRMTVRHALSTLEAEGYLTRVPGSGTFVSKPKVEQRLLSVTSFSEDMKLLGMTPEGRTLASAIIEADARIAEHLGLEAGQPVIQFQRLRLADGAPMALETSNLPLSLFPGLERVDLEAHSLYGVLKERFGVQPARATQSLEVMLAGTFEAGLLNVRTGAPLLLLERVTQDASDQVIEYVRSFYRGDRFRFLTELR